MTRRDFRVEKQLAFGTVKGVLFIKVPLLCVSSLEGLICAIMCVNRSNDWIFQVAREIQRMIERDHELLHLYVEATKDPCEDKRAYAHAV